MAGPAYSEFAPGGLLAGYVRLFWDYEGPAAADEGFSSIPLALPELVVVLDGAVASLSDGMVFASPSAALAGIQLTRKAFRSEGRARLFGVAFEPAGLAPFLDLPPAAIADAVLPAAAASARLSALGPALAAAAGAEARADAARSRLEAAAGSFPAAQPSPADAACRLIERSRGTASIGAVARRLGVSESALRRAFAARVGVSPKAYAEAVRHAAAMDAAAEAGAWTDLAVGLDYYDQSHLTKEFRRRMGTTPGAFIAEKKTPLEETILGKARFLQ